VRLTLWTLVMVAFVGMGMWMLDPDYGWHISMGKYILEKGIPKTDPFSYTMPSYPFVDHAWLASVLMYEGDKWLGKNGLAVVFGLIAAATLGLVGKKKGWELAVLLGGGLLIYQAGVRPQVLDWIFVAIIWKFFSNEEIWKKWRFGIVGMFWLWGNLHGGFVIGLLMLLWMMVSKGIEERRWDVKNLTVWFLSLGATFINPYLWRTWWEVWMTFSDTGLHGRIAEWMPFYYQTQPTFWFLVILWVMLVVWEKKKEWWKISTLAITLVAGLFSIRNLAFFTLLAILELPKLMENFWNQIAKNEIKKRAKYFYILMVGIAVGAFLLVTSILAVKIGNKELSYPAGAVRFLKGRETFGNIFSTYNWGGYLIWKYPEKKVFIDGRMPSWRMNSKGVETASAMEEYLQISETGNYREIFTKYNIKIALLPSSSNQLWGDRMLENLMKTEKIPLRERLEGDGWKKIYEDESCVVYINEL